MGEDLGVEGLIHPRECRLCLRSTGSGLPREWGLPTAFIPLYRSDLPIPLHVESFLLKMGILNNVVSTLEIRSLRTLCVCRSLFMNFQSQFCRVCIVCVYLASWSAKDSREISLNAWKQQVSRSLLLGCVLGFRSALKTQPGVWEVCLGLTLYSSRVLGSARRESFHALGLPWAWASLWAWAGLPAGVQPSRCPGICQSIRNPPQDTCSSSFPF